MKNEILRNKTCENEILQNGRLHKDKPNHAEIKNEALTNPKPHKDKSHNETLKNRRLQKDELLKEKLVLVTLRAEIEMMYSKELERIFGDLLDISSYSTQQGDDSSALKTLVSHADILLITSVDVFEQIRPFVSERCRIIMLQYGFLKENIEHLKTLPPSTSALVCFNYHQASAQIVAMLYEQGMRNLDLAAYRIGDPIDASLYDIAIVGDNSAIVPPGIRRVISIGMRKLSLSTLLSIASAADILTEDLELVFQEYCGELYTENPVFARFYDIFSVNKIQLKTIMNCIDYAIIICSGDYRVLDFNDNVKNLLGIRRNISRLHLESIPELSAIAPQITAQEPLKNILVEISPQKSFLLSREDISSAWKTDDYHIILLKDVTRILTLEQSFKKQLSKKGHVAKYAFSSILGGSQAIQLCVSRAKMIARLDKPTLITGESGTGKELFAQSIHNYSSRRHFPFLALNCAALPASLLESELFGYTDGAFTGAKKGGHTGLFEQANKGTFFLDEIGEISLETQAKLLRVLEEREIMRVGSGEIVPIDVRIIAATNRKLRKLVREGTFRLDLYYRLNTLELYIPPMRERREDIPLLVQHVLDQENLSHIRVSKEAMDFFIDFNWEGNVRELRNCVEYMAHISHGAITLEHLPNYIVEEYEDYSAADACPINGFSESDRAMALEILKLVDMRETGRQAMLSDMRSLYPAISDYRLRQLIDRLRKHRLLRVNKGRKGMELTILGRHALIRNPPPR